MRDEQDSIGGVLKGNGVNKGWSFNLGSVHHPFAEWIVNYYRKAAAETFVAH